MSAERLPHTLVFLESHIRLMYEAIASSINTLIDDLATTDAKITSLPTYADNAAALAGGLVAGQFYKTATGQVMVVY